MNPPKSILDPTFAYTSSTHTDLRKTFARIKAERARVGKQQRFARPTSLVEVPRSGRR